MKKIKKLLKSINAFTLTELVCAIGLSAIIILIIYTMLLSAHQSFSRLYDSSKSANNIRFFTNSLRNSMSYAYSISAVGGAGTAGSFVFYRYDDYKGKNVAEKYFLTGGGGTIAANAAYARTLSSLTAVSPYGSAGTLVKINPSTAADSFLVMTGVRNIYYTITSNSATTIGGSTDLYLGIIYDEVRDDGKGNKITRQKRRNINVSSKRVY